MSSARQGSVIILADLCKGCGLCVAACPVEVIGLSTALNRYSYHFAVATDGCTGCGICWYACPEPGAITVYKQEAVA